MKTTDRCEKANWLLATLLGWTNLTSAGGALLGTPPAGAEHSRGQAQVPDWCGSWEACGPLMIEQRCLPEFGLLERGVVYVKRDGKALGSLAVSDFPSQGHAVRTAIVYAAIGILKNRQPIPAPQGANDGNG